MPEVTQVTERELKKQAIVESLKNNSTWTEACEAADVTRVSAWRWKKEDELFAELCEEAVKSRIQTIKDVAFANALKSKENPAYQTSLIAWLNNEADWTNKTRAEVYNHNDTPITEEEALKTLQDMYQKHGIIPSNISEGQE